MSSPIPITEPTIIAAFIVAIAGPMVLGFLNNRARKAERREDFARQAVTINKLEVIHTLVNSGMVAALQSELDSIRRELVLMDEVVSLRREIGHSPAAGAFTAMKVAESKAASLEKEIAARQPTQPSTPPCHSIPGST